MGTQGALWLACVLLPWALAATVALGLLVRVLYRRARR